MYFSAIDAKFAPVSIDASVEWCYQSMCLLNLLLYCRSGTVRYISHFCLYSWHFFSSLTCNPLTVIFSVNLNSSGHVLQPRLLHCCDDLCSDCGAGSPSYLFLKTWFPIDECFLVAKTILISPHILLMSLSSSFTTFFNWELSGENFSENTRLCCFERWSASLGGRDMFYFSETLVTAFGSISSRVVILCPHFCKSFFKSWMSSTRVWLKLY